jgi:hypothetical protein
MATDIHSYTELRDGPDGPWRLVERPELDEDGRYDVPGDAQPFRGVRSSAFLAVLTGLFTTRVDLDYSLLVPIVPEDREPPDDLGPELARIYDGWREAGAGAPYTLTLRDLEATDWERPVYSTDGRSQPLESYAPFARSALDELRRLSAGRSGEDVRLVFWFDS